MASRLIGRFFISNHVSLAKENFDSSAQQCILAVALFIIYNSLYRKRNRAHKSILMGKIDE